MAITKNVNDLTLQATVPRTEVVGLSGLYTVSWPNVNGTGRPADNATVGAAFGTNITGQITSGNASTYIQAGAIQATQIAADSINSSKIQAGSILASDIAAGTITADRMSVSTLSAITANLGTVNAGSITGSAGINITGLAQFAGNNLNVPSGKYAALIATSTGNTLNGVLGYASGTGSSGVVGYIPSGSSVGVTGYSAGSGAAMDAIAGGTGVGLNCNGFVISNSGLVNNLNANYVGGKTIAQIVSSFATQSGAATATGNYLGLYMSGSLAASYRTTASGVTINITDISDEQVKQDITPETLGLEFINKVEPVTFRLKADPKMLCHGFTAQRMQKLISKTNVDNILTQSDVDDLMGVGYIALIAPMVKAIQELTAQVAELQQQLIKQ